MHILRIDCPDRPGIVAAVAVTLRDCGGNILESSQFGDAPAGRFFMRTVFDSAGDPDYAGKFAAAFAQVAAEFGMDWHLDDVEARPRCLVMVSKADHCLNDILYRWRTGQLPLTITGIVSNHEDARRHAQINDVPFTHLPITPETKIAQEACLDRLVEETGTELIVLARYMQILSPNLCARMHGRVINIHHSFLPGFKGAKPYHQAYERGVKLIGATAHYVTSDLDEGPIIEQETARIDHTMPPAALQVIGQDIESRVLSRALTLYAERRIFLQGNRTVIL